MSLEESPGEGGEKGIDTAGAEGQDKGGNKGKKLDKDSLNELVEEDTDADFVSDVLVAKWNAVRENAKLDVALLNKLTQNDIKNHFFTSHTTRADYCSQIYYHDSYR